MLWRTRSSDAGSGGAPQQQQQQQQQPPGDAPTASAAAAPQHQQQQQHSPSSSIKDLDLDPTPLPGPAPRVRSQFLRRDYAAQCPKQHLAFLRCMREENTSWLPSAPWACAEELRVFETCTAIARAQADPLQQTAKTSAADAWWQQFKQDPLWADVRQHLSGLLRDAAAAVGLGGEASAAGAAGVDPAGGSSGSSSAPPDRSR